MSYKKLFPFCLSLDNKKGLVKLGGSTVEKPLRPGEKAFTKIEGSFVTGPETYVT